MKSIDIDSVDGVRIITLAHEKPTNPVGKKTAEAFMKAIREADADDSVKAIVVTGGRDRCFSAGGDFNEARMLSSDDVVNETIDWCTDLYLSVLDTSKPTIAAIDRHAVGLGFQLAMMFDWKMMSTRADLFMPELEHGIGASVGATIIGTACSYDVARNVVMSCQTISPDSALRLGMVDEICEPEFLLERALMRANRLGRYPKIAFSATKKVLTNPMRAALENTREQSKAVHRQAFGAKAMTKHFDNILGTRSDEVVSAT
ncbi:enoyl-CoA hydratase/isomerase family protein [Nocardia sp. NBC_01327]|uniref:enoyl-CoA hydratase/isomerase family protein n=1 Tax=Nocardia sp. NBC_01327 TaxID=2903593 RepID=UPI002E157A6B|nr:enoyl-CoA hydratase/isomerase family protein [Nocardia sp. NBC_01327]